MKLSRFAAGIFAFAGVSGLLSVALAALAVHALASIAPAGEQAVIWFREGTAFQMNHTLALVLVTIVAEWADAGRARRVLQTAAVFMVAGIVMFPGSLYSVSFGGPVMFAPVGGVAVMCGWALFAVGAILAARPSSSDHSSSVEQD